MVKYLLLMVLSTGELIHSDVTPEFCLEYAQNIRSGNIPKVGDGPDDAVTVAVALCAPADVIERSFPRLETGSTK